MKLRLLVVLMLYFLKIITGWSQVSGELFDNNKRSFPNDWEVMFDDIELQIDTVIYRWSDDNVSHGDEKKLGFIFQKNSEVATIRLTPRKAFTRYQIELIEGDGYAILENLIYENNTYHSGKIRLQGLSDIDLLGLRFKVSKKDPKEEMVFRLPLFPYTDMYAKIYPGSGELFIGKEYTFEIITNNSDNIQADQVWKDLEYFSYRIFNEDTKVFISVIGKKLGTSTLDIRIPLKRPIVSDDNRSVYSLPPWDYTFEIKRSPLSFLALDRTDFVWDENSRTGIEIEMEDGKGIKLEKTYRLESREQAGGHLVAEIYTRRRLSNGKILCWLRIYNFHRRSDGYLYLKDGDLPIFMTNFDVSPKTVINRIELQREGQDFTESLSVFPGETIEIKVEGVSLDRANFTFEDIGGAYKDTLLKSDKIHTYKLQIPKDISKKRLIIYNNGQSTGYNLSINEFQKARPLDFIMLSYEQNGREKSVTLNRITSAIMHIGTLKDVIIKPVPSRIDDESALHGKQYVTIKITLTGPNRDLVEMRTVENMVICPDQTSPRYLFYQDKDCQSGAFNINSILSRKTNELNGWSRVEIEISHRREKHDDEAYTHRAEFILTRNYEFDIDVSFPAGLLQIRPDRPNERLSSFSGVSLAALAQFSFFKPGQIARYQPYRVGVGTIAMNAFDFSNESADRGLALVALGSLSPTRPNPKLRLTLYFGGGYFLTNADNIRTPPGWFFLIGPGVAVRL